MRILSSEGSFGIECISKGESQVVKLLQEPDGSGGREMINCKRARSNHTVLRCKFGSWRFHLAESSTLHCSRYFCKIEPGRVFVLQICLPALQSAVWLCGSIGDFPYCKGARLHCSSRVGYVHRAAWMIQTDLFSLTPSSHHRISLISTLMFLICTSISLICSSAVDRAVVGRAVSVAGCQSASGGQASTVNAPL